MSDSQHKEKSPSELLAMLQTVSKAHEDAQRAFETALSNPASKVAMAVQPEHQREMLSASSQINLELRNNIVELTRDLELARQKIAVLSAHKDEILKLRSEDLYTKDQLNRTDEQLDRTEDELKRTNDELKRTKNELKGTKNELNGTKNELNGTKDELNGIQDELNRTKQDLALERQKSGLLDVNLHLRFDNLRIQDELNRTKDELDSTKQDLEFARSKIAVLDGKKDYSMEIAKLKLELSVAREQLKAAGLED